jgi:PAS domain S-box-containing protein
VASLADQVVELKRNLTELQSSVDTPRFATTLQTAIKQWEQVQVELEAYTQPNMQHFYASAYEALFRLVERNATTTQELVDQAIEEAEIITGSRIGYLHFVNAAQLGIQLFTWSKAAREQCYDEKEQHRSLDLASIWADCVRLQQPVIHNDYANYPGRKGHPNGHIEIQRHLGVPVFQGNEVVAILGVGNKVDSYTEDDALQLMSFARSFWLLVQQKRAEERLQQSEARLTLGMHLADMGVWDWDVASDRMEWYGEMFRIYGITPDEFTGRGKDYINFAREDYRAAQTAHVQEAFAKGITEAELLAGRKFPFDPKAQFIVQPNGTERYTLSDTLAIVDQDGKPLRMLGVMLDLTERQHTENALRESEQKFRTISEQSMMGISIMQDNQIKYINQAVSDINGYTAEEMLGWSTIDFMKLIHPDDLAFSSDQAQRKMRGDSDFQQHYQYRLITKGGEVKWVDQYSKPILYNGRFANLGTLIDITARKVAEQALKRSEANLLAILNNSDLSYVLMDAETRIIAVNQQAVHTSQTMFGSGVRLGTPFHQYLEGWNREGFEKNFATALTGGKGTAEYMFMLPDGSRQYIEFHYFPAFDESGIVLGVCQTAQDVSARKEAEAEMQRRDRILEAVSIASDKLLKAVDYRDEIAHVLAILGISDEADRAAIYEFHPDSDGQMLASMRYDWNAPGIPSQFENRRSQNLQIVAEGFGIILEHLRQRMPISYHIRDGLIGTPLAADTKSSLHLPVFLHDTLWGSLHFSTVYQEHAWSKTELDALQVAANMLGTCIERRLAEEATIAAEHQQRMILDHALDGFVVIDLEGHILEMNEAYNQQLGYTRDELLHFSIPDIEAIESPSDFLKHIEYIKLRGSDRFETKQLRKDGQTIDVEVSVTFLPELNRLSTFQRDITDRKRAEETRRERDRLQQALEHEKELNGLKSRFISMVSHEFRTPMSVIQLNTELLQRYTTHIHDEQLQKRLAKIQIQIELMVKLLDEVLTVSRLEHQKQPFQPVYLNIQQYCQEMINALQEIFPDHVFTFTIDSEVGIRLVDCDILQHILDNLLTNAVKYSPAGSTVALEVQGQLNHVTFIVRDQGIGIPTKDQPRMFESFFRATNVGQIKGTGLGLTIARLMTERHGGIIAFQSVVNQGTTFTVVIPALRS